MYLKSLELQGFKSFPDKIKLHFDQGLTAVVGPNGSGKSNIGDSVRWVLGEQSTKTLRGSKMEDVIFSGTVGIKPMSFASVTLVIDNSENRLSGYGEEVSINRKLYRSGDSEYRINGKVVRLKDIHELFMDTGLGRDGYSIIGQGRIAEIVGAKNSERREIFEEAAGISKFRYQKAEAERKLSQTQEKMERVRDIFQELENRIPSLKAQSEKAKKFLVLSQQEKQLEVSVWIDQLDEQEKKLISVKESLLSKKTEYERTERLISSEENKIQTCDLKMQEYAADADESRSLVRSLRTQAELVQTNIAVWKNDVIHQQEALKLLKSRHEQDMQEQTRFLSQQEQAEQNLHVIQENVLKLQKQLSASESAFHQAEQNVHDKEMQVHQAEETFHQAELNRNELQYIMRSAEEKANQQKQQFQELEQQISISQENLKHADQNHQQAVSIIETIRKNIAEQEQNLKAFQDALQEISSQKQIAEEKLKQLGFQLRDKKQRHRILSDLEHNMEGFSGSVKAVMKAVSQGILSDIYGSVAQLIQVNPQYGIAIETALGASMQHLVTADENAAKAGIKFLRDTRAGRATFLPMTTIKSRFISQQDLQMLHHLPGFIAAASDLVTCDDQFRPIAENLLGRILIAQTIDDASEIAKHCRYQYRIVTTDGQVINAGGSFTGGSVQKTGGMLTRRTELNTLQEEMQKLVKICADAEQDARNQAEQESQARQKLESGMKIREELQQNFLKAQSETERCAFALEQHQQKIQEYAQRKKALEMQSAQADQSIHQAKKQLEQNQHQIRQAEEIVSQIRADQQTCRQQRELLSIKYHDLKIQLAQAEKDQEAAETALHQIQDSVQNAHEREAAYLHETQNADMIIKQKTDAIQEQEKLLSKTREQISNAENAARTALQAHDLQSQEARKLQSGLKIYYAEKEKLSTEMTKLSEKQTSIQINCDQIIEKLFEIYELTRSEAQEMAQPIEDMISAKKTLSELKQKIRALGSISLDSIQEYQEVFERHAFYARQIKDIRNAIQELEKIIQNLTSEMCRIFKENFRIINQNFQEIFRDLFGGGRAELILTEPDQVLTSGIEISVAPPGKVIKNLISLSGGEQSFVAIAIYFAILRLRPAPFCILDEIDAALDEANVRKYARYLKKFTDHTQFVLVTHRRSAMEEANVLYGVTMEDGVSRLLKMPDIS